MKQITWSVFFAQLAGIGKSPVAPGTAATLMVGAPAAWLLSRVSLPVAIGALVALFVFACWAADLAEKQANRVDPGEIVIDELVGYLVTMIGVPLGWKSLLLGFLLFRCFDIFKPWPVSWFNKDQPGGIWIVLDDVAAGVYAHLLLWGILLLWP